LIPPRWEAHPSRPVFRFIGDGEGWFEAVNWVEAAREARGRYVMITLGACYAAQAVGDQSRDVIATSAT
jgi:hypothetical protein